SSTDASTERRKPKTHPAAPVPALPRAPMHMPESGRGGGVVHPPGPVGFPRLAGAPPGGRRAVLQEVQMTEDTTSRGQGAPATGDEPAHDPADVDRDHGRRAGTDEGTATHHTDIIGRTDPAATRPGATI